MLVAPNRSPDLITPRSNNKGPSSYWFSELICLPGPNCAYVKMGVYAGKLYFDWHGNPEWIEEITAMYFNKLVQKSFRTYISPARGDDV